MHDRKKWRNYYHHVEPKEEEEFVWNTDCLQDDIKPFIQLMSGLSVGSSTEQSSSQEL